MTHALFKNSLSALVLLLMLGTLHANARQYRLTSPDGKLNVTIDTDEQLRWSITHDGTTVLLPSAIALQGVDESDDTFTWGANAKVSRTKRTSVQTSFPTPF